MKNTFIALLSTLWMAGCDVGSVPVGGTPDSGGGGGQKDSGGGGGTDASNANACAPAQAPNAAHVHSGGGTNAGLNCMTAPGCHGDQPGAGGVFAFAGTLYTSAAATTPKTGATIRVLSNGNTLPAATDDAGNFYGNGTLTFPANTLATSCPTLTNMATPLAAGAGATPLATGGGACNNCHKIGAGAQAPPINIP
jgi:hypothetical protein